MVGSLSLYCVGSIPWSQPLLNLLVLRDLGKRFPLNITEYLFSAVNAEKECSIDKAKSTADESIKCSWTVKI